MSRSAHPPDKLRTAISVLNRARESMLDQMAEIVVSMADEFAEGGFQVNEFLELHGSRLHFLCLMIGQFELLSDARTPAKPPVREPSKEKRPRRREGPKRTSAGEDAPPSSSGEEA